MAPELDKHRVNRDIDNARRRFDDLCRRVGTSQNEQGLTPEALQELSTALEELGVVTEELRQQNDELAVTRELVEAERRHYQELFEFAPDGYLITDRNGVVHEVNRNAAKLLGLRADLLIGKPLIVHIPQHEHSPFRQLLTRIHKGEPTLSHETEIQPRGRPRFPAVLMVSGVPNENRLRWIMSDISARKAADRALETQLRRISVLGDINAAITSTLDLQTVLEVLLDRLKLLFPYPIVATIRLNLPDTGKLQHVICRGLDVAEWQAHELSVPGQRTLEVIESKTPLAVRNVQTDPRSRALEFYVRNNLVSYLGVPLTIKDEVLGIFCLYTREEHDFSNEEISSFSALAVQASLAIHNSQIYAQLKDQASQLQRARDDLELRVEERTRQLAEANEVLKTEIAERRQVEDRLRESERRLSAIANELEEQLIASDRLVSIGELAASIAHEFNNPLQIILGFAQDLATEPDLPESGQQNLKIIEQEVLRCRKIIKNVLDFARPKNAELISAFIEPIIRESITLVRSHLERSKIAVQIDIPADLPRIHGDPQQLKQVLINLFFNAAEAMPEGGKLAIRAAAANAAAQTNGRDELVISVSDTGSGINPDSMASIFRPFFTTKKKRGTGLGLSICDRIMKAHGGSVSVESKQGAGTTFYLRFPLMEAKNREASA
jgi:two-component system NtrC family sensor kinase